MALCSFKLEFLCFQLFFFSPLNDMEKNIAFAMKFPMYTKYRMKKKCKFVNLCFWLGIYGLQSEMPCNGIKMYMHILFCQYNFSSCTMSFYVCESNRPCHLFACFQNTSTSVQTNNNNYGCVCVHLFVEQNTNTRTMHIG